MMEQLISFFKTNGYILELIICNLLFSFSQNKRPLYSLRLLLTMLGMLASALILNQVLVSSVFFNLFKYLVWFLLSLVGNVFMYAISFKVAMFICIGAFITQHMSFKIGEVVLYFMPDTISPHLYNALYILTIAAVYAISYFVFARRFKRLNVNNAKQNQLFTLYFAVLIYVTILQYYFTDYISRVPTQLYLIYASFDIICCLFAMMLQFGIIESSSLKEESKLMEHILYMQNEKYRLSKETIELINIKFHDLKKQLSFLGTADEEEVQRLYQAMNLYDMSIKSGNEALDIVLAEKSLLCEGQHIRLECMADGESLSFMNTSDVYALIGNAIDNAIESTLKVPELDRRFINISIKKTRELLTIHISNPYDGELQFLDGLPQTTKNDKNFHGFGMKSIQKVVEKYGGYLSIAAEDQFFVLNIIMMCPAKPSAKG